MAWRMVIGLLLAATGCMTALSQAASTRASGQQSRQRAPYVLKMYTRAVLTDVTVTDKRGRPVTGLKAQDFRVFDNGRPEQLTSFEEHRERKAQVEEASSQPGVFNNNFLRHLPPQVNVLLFDTTTIRIVDQMYLFQQMRRFVQNLPSGEPVAVFVRSGEVTLQLLGFTDNHAELMAAIQRAIPKLRQPGSWMADDMETLNQMALYLSQVPGRKNLIWFTGGSNLYLDMGVGMDPAMVDPGYAEEREQIYDLLEKERIAIYPIDARGLTVAMPNPWQQMLMREDAQATGGMAYLNTNGLAQAAQRIISTDGNYYTLMYSPEGLRNDGKWHRVAVKLAGGVAYELSYRRGYFDDGHNQQHAPQGKTRKLLKASGKEEDVPNDRSNPIVFAAQVVPADAGADLGAKVAPVKRGEQRYIVRYFVPARDLHPAKVEGPSGTYVLGWAALAFDSHGSPVEKRMQAVAIRVDEAQVRAIPDGKVAFTETVNLPKGRNYLYLAVWDTVTERMGTVNAEVNVGKAAKKR